MVINKNIVALLLANMLLLAHHVVPHHYHEETGLCFFIHCIDSKEVHQHEDNDLREHQHDGNPNADKCSVDTDYTLIDNNKKNTEGLPTLKCNYEQAFADHCLVNHIAVSFRLQPYLPQFYPEFIACAIGLRAPPRDC